VQELVQQTHFQPQYRSGTQTLPSTSWSKSPVGAGFATNDDFDFQDIAEDTGPFLLIQPKCQVLMNLCEC
jgi:hypothetical protein